MSALVGFEIAGLTILQAQVGAVLLQLLRIEMGQGSETRNGIFTHRTKKWAATSKTSINDGSAPGRDKLVEQSAAQVCHTGLAGNHRLKMFGASAGWLHLVM